MSGVSVFQWLVDTSIDVSVLVVLVLALRGTVVRLFGVSFGYLLWLVPAARLAFSILPIQVQGAVSVLVLPDFLHAPAGTIPSAAMEPGSAATSILMGIWADRIHRCAGARLACPGSKQSTNPRIISTPGAGISTQSGPLLSAHGRIPCR